MPLDLSTYRGIYTAVFVKLTVPILGTYRYSTHYKPYNIVEADSVSYEYNQLGSILGVTDAESAIRTNTSEITITLSGIPTSNVTNFTDYEIKGSKVEVRRIYFTADNHLPIGTPLIKFAGIVNSVGVQEEWNDDKNAVTTISISLICSSLTDLLTEKRSGRRTNSMDQKSFYPTDLSMDRVTYIANTNFQFGAKRA